MKLLIIGSVGSGKSTLAKKISRENNIPYYEIDKIVYDENDQKRSHASQKKLIASINQNDWIIEGVLRHHLYFLLNLADKIIFLDVPKSIRIKRIIKRYIKQVLGLETSAYKPTLAMLFKMFKWTREFEHNRQNYLKQLEKYQNKLSIINN